MKPDTPLVCFRCGRRPNQIAEYIEAAVDERMTPDEYVAAEEGTLNRTNGHFACTDCYIEIGMPVATPTWRAP